MTSKLKQILNQHEAELLAELDDVRRAKTAIGMMGSDAEIPHTGEPVEDLGTVAHGIGTGNGSDGGTGTANGDTAETKIMKDGKTIKEMIQITLGEKFPQGARAKDICTFLNQNSTREIKQGSLAPILSTMAKDGILRHNPDAGVWSLAPAPR